MNSYQGLPWHAKCGPGCKTLTSPRLRSCCRFSRASIGSISRCPAIRVPVPDPRAHGTNPKIYCPISKLCRMREKGAFIRTVVRNRGVSVTIVGTIRRFREWVFWFARSNGLAITQKAQEMSIATSSRERKRHIKS
jgi:hypothetical protein